MSIYSLYNEFREGKNIDINQVFMKSKGKGVNTYDIDFNYNYSNIDTSNKCASNNLYNFLVVDKSWYNKKFLKGI